MTYMTMQPIGKGIVNKGNGKVLSYVSPSVSVNKALIAAVFRPVDTTVPKPQNFPIPKPTQKPKAGTLTLPCFR